jgi:hypothetical protein
LLGNKKPMRQHRIQKKIPYYYSITNCTSYSKKVKK